MITRYNQTEASEAVSGQRRIPSEPHIVFVSQKVKDIKVPPNGALETEMGKLRAGLRKHLFIPGDKVTGNLKINKIKNGTVHIDISGFTRELNMIIHHLFPLRINNYTGPLDVQSVFSQVEGSEVDDGGNIQNSIINLVLALTCSDLRDFLKSRNSKLRITILSSSEPFASFPPPLADAMRSLCDIFILDIPDRYAVQLPYEENGQHGTISIASEPQRTNDALRQLITKDRNVANAFKNPTCIVSADPLYDVLQDFVRPPYAYIINASTAFRSLVATQSYYRSVILPMNNLEAADVCRLLLQRGLDEELNRISRPPFESPLMSNGAEIDFDSLRTLDESLSMLITFNPLFRSVNRQSFTCPITFGPQGGLVVSTGRYDLACFTSTPQNDKALLEEFGDPEKTALDRAHEVGAGDSVAAIITFFNAIEPYHFLSSYLKGREGEDQQLVELASLVFVSVLGRLAGSFLVHTSRTNWSNVRTGSFYCLFDETAKESLVVARSIVKKLHAPVLGDVKRWGIKVVAWQPGQVAYPDSSAWPQLERLPVFADKNDR